MSNVIYGINPIFEALSTNDSIITEIIIQVGKENKRVKRIMQLADKKDILVRYEAKNEINLICSKNHQGVVAMISDFTYKGLSGLLDELVQKKDAKILFVDCVEDPHNLGALIRSACAFYFDGVVIQERRSATVTASVIKASSGAIFHIPVCMVKNINNALKAAKDSGFWSVGMVLDTTKRINELDMKMKIALVVGNEEKGIRDLVAKNCDFLVRIPICEKVDSLNAAAAGACAMYEIVRQQKAN
jgi:23S rRNA (guanosine2251-2'-O)-methyltransferase